MKGIIIGIAVFFGIAFASEPAQVGEVNCTALLVLKDDSGIIQVRDGKQPEIRYALASCEDVQYKGGGVVIRHYTDLLTGAWATVYYPAYRIRSVTVKPK